MMNAHKIDSHPKQIEYESKRVIWTTRVINAVENAMKTSKDTSTIIEKDRSK